MAWISLAWLGGNFLFNSHNLNSFVTHLGWGLILFGFKIGWTTLLFVLVVILPKLAKSFSI
jgi:hypothetical protein